MSYEVSPAALRPLTPTGFVPVEERDDRPNDRIYPVSWWSARDGVDDDALRLFLPALIR